MNTNRGFVPILTIIIVAVIAIGGGYWVYQEVGGDVNFNLPPLELSNDDPENTFNTNLVSPIGATYVEPAEPVACTMEAKICPDGSAVGRTGPKCEFAACPAVSSNVPTGWKEYKNTEFGFKLFYPTNYTDIVPRNDGDLSPAIGAFWSTTAKVAVLGRGQMHEGDSLLVNVFKLSNYVSEDIPSGETISLNLSNKTCDRAYAYNKVDKTPMITLGKWTGCWVGEGDAGFSYRAYAVPIPSKNIVLEIGFSHDESTNLNITDLSLAASIVATLQEI